MGTFSDAILGGPIKSVAAPEEEKRGIGAFARPVAAPVPSFSDAILGRSELPAEAAKPTDKDITDDSAKTLGFGAQTIGSFASDEAEWVRHAARTLYPSEPIDQAAKRFAKTKEGRWYHTDDEGKRYFATPYSGIARLGNIGSGIGHALPIGGGTAAGILTAPAAVTGVGLLGTMAASGGGAVGGELLRQKIGDYLLGPAATNHIAIPEVVTQGGHAFLGQGVGAGFGAWLSRNAVPDIAQYSSQNASRLMQAAEQRGIRLTPGEAANLESMIAEQKRLQGVPQSANVMRTFSQERNQEVVGAFNDFLNRVGRPQDAATLGRTASETAQGLLEGAQRARTAAVDPFYAQARREIQHVDSTPILQHIQQELVHAKGAIRTALERARQELTTAGPNGARVPDTSFQGLNNAKMAIDALLENPDAAARVGIDRSAYGALSAVRDRLVNAIDGAMNNSGAYRMGRETYGRISEHEVEPLRQALQPLLNGSRDTANLSAVAQNLFDAKRRSPEQIAAARTAMMQAAPDLWNSLTRQFMREEAANALKTMAHGDLRNVGGGISKALGDEFTTANLRAALSPQQFRDFQEMVDVFRATARAMDSNSDTAFKQEMIKRAKMAAGGWMSRTVRNLNPAKLVENAAEFFANRNYDRQAEAIARIITSGDRDAILRLQQLRQLQPGDWRRYAVMGHILERSGAFAAEKAVGE